MSQEQRRVFSRDQLLRLRASSTRARPCHRVRRKLWYLGLLRHCERGDDDNIGEEGASWGTRGLSADLSAAAPPDLQDSRPAQPEPRGTEPPTARSPRTALAVTPTPHPNNLRIATYNVRTLRAEWRVQELVRLSSDLGISILAIQEHRHQTEISIPDLAGCEWTFRTMPSSPSGCGGVGLLLSPAASKALLDFRSLSNRIAHASFALIDRRLHIIAVYAPTSPNTDANPAETESFYDCLSDSLDQIPSRDHVFITGDFNAPLSVDGSRVKNSCGAPNSNSSHLSSFFQARDLLPVNGYLRQRLRNLPTFHGPNNRKTRLDWIFCRFNMRTRIQKVFNIRPKAVNSDHSLLGCAVNLRWPPHKLSTPRPDWTQLENASTRDLFVSKLNDTPNFANSPSSFATAIKAASSILPRTNPHLPKALWLADAHINEARRQLQSATSKYGIHSAQSIEARAHLQSTYERRSREVVDGVAEEIQAATDNCRHSAAWKAINRISGRMHQPHQLISANSKEHRKQLLVSHYKRILNCSPPTADLSPIPNLQQADSELFDVTPFTEEEVSAAVKSTRVTAAAGADDIPPRVLKLPQLTAAITDLLNSNSCLGGDSRVRADSSWRTSKIVSISKSSGGSTNLDNQRGIALECALPKLLNTLLRNRLLPLLNPLLLSLQSGFRPGRSTTEQLATLRCIVDDCRTRKQRISIVFIDFRKAFDSLCRSVIAKLLAFHGVPELLITAVMDLYTNSSAFIQTSSGPTSTFQTSSGVLQGDPLSPLLFVLAVDYILRRVLEEEESYIVERRRSSRHPETTLPALAYADDIALLCRDPSSAQSAVVRLFNESAKLGLTINPKKTKVLHMGSSSSPPLRLPDGQEVEPCTDYKYLGIGLTDPDAVIQDRRTQAWRASYRLRGIFNAPIEDATKMKLFRAAVESILLYGLEAIPMTATRENKLDAIHRRLLRYALGIHYPERISNIALRARAAVPTLSASLRSRRLRLIGHALRSYGRGDKVPLAIVLLHHSKEPLRRGHGRTVTLRASFIAELSSIDLTPIEATTLPSNLFKQRVCARV